MPLSKPKAELRVSHEKESTALPGGAFFFAVAPALGDCVRFRAVEHQATYLSCRRRRKSPFGRILSCCVRKATRTSGQEERNSGKNNTLCRRPVGYLVDYTTTFEVHVGNFTLFHSGDCCSCAKFQPKRKPDLWVLHPYCGMNPAEASRTVVHPKKVVIAHLQEMCHSRNRYRWTYRDGLKVKDSLLQAGVDSVIPMWGERIL